MGKFFSSLKNAAKDFTDDECAISGAAIAYYTIFALPPLLVIVFFISGLFGVSQERMDRLVKNQLGIPTATVAGQQSQSNSGMEPEPGTAERRARRQIEPRSAALSESTQPTSQADRNSFKDDPQALDSGRPVPPPSPESRDNPQPMHWESAETKTLEQPAHTTEPPLPETGTTTATPLSSASRPPQSAAEASTAQGQSRESGRAKKQTGPVSGLGLLSTVIGVLVLVFSATGVFSQLQYALNRAWEVKPDPNQGGIWRFLFKRVLSLGMVAVIAFLLLVSLVLTTYIDELVRVVTGDSSTVSAKAIGIVLNAAGTLMLATVLFAAMYKLLPDAKMRWKDTWIGAFITALLFVIGKSLLGLYLENSSVSSTWGAAAASMVAMLVWVYYSTMIVLFGAELAQVWANVHGAGIEPAPGAIRAVQETRHLRQSRT